MKLFTHASPSHEQLLQSYLLPSTTEFTDVIIGRAPQAAAAEFGDPAWGRNTVHKALTMRRAVRECPDFVVWADADVVFLRPSIDRLLECLGPHDIACQDDGGVLCSGLWIARCSVVTQTLFDCVCQDGSFYRGQATTDQAALNHYIKQLRVSAVALPLDEFASAGYCHGTWNEWDGKPFTLPPTVRVFHANWCRGIPNKTRLLAMATESRTTARAS
ncbi:MAG: putative nucleotide-diphospho-sugar transferase [Pirellulaceae bacterium]